ncbi:hypothetical protein CAPTEDRAFT_193568 [Capitella teleta]|uniref:Uncharacterized protein n=1 Tax=Capitella teleta TaxID=283909 RepID=R7T5R5_CAPTE|nr:hypothetical protein CAPTEDRAFT_193568 [Capitella teleta]|eukprot:ELT88640.1 hypothetical protein CAPTEDRAFT_193568 [Capitella teleta]
MAANFEESDDDDTEYLEVEDLQNDPDFVPDIDTETASELDESNIQEMPSVLDKSTKGASYINTNGKQQVAKKVGAACSCKKKCFEKIGEFRIQQIFDEFYAMETKSVQDAYLFGLMKKRKPKRKRLRDGSRGQKSVSVQYYVKKDGCDMEVCKVAFKSIHGLGKSRFNKLRDAENHAPIERRGKHGKQRRLEESLRKKVNEHISKFPTLTSHYSRAQNPNKSY